MLDADLSLSIINFGSKWYKKRGSVFANIAKLVVLLLNPFQLNEGLKLFGYGILRAQMSLFYNIKLLIL